MKSTVTVYIYESRQSRKQYEIGSMLSQCILRYYLLKAPPWWAPLEIFEKLASQIAGECPPRTKKYDIEYIRIFIKYQILLINTFNVPVVDLCFKQKRKGRENWHPRLSENALPAPKLYIPSLISQFFLQIRNTHFLQNSRNKLF